MNEISIRDTFAKSWTIVKSNIALFSAVTFVVLALQIAISFFEQNNELSPLSGIVSLVGFVLSFAVGICTTSALIKVARDEKPALRLLKVSEMQVLRYIVVTILLTLAMILSAIPLLITLAIFFVIGGSVGNFDFNSGGFIIGLILAIAVIAYVNIRLLFALYLVVDEKTGIVDSLKTSWKMTKGKIWEIILFGLAAIVITLLGLLAIVVGLLVAIPVAALAFAIFYVTLYGQFEVNSPVPTPHE